MVDSITNFSLPCKSRQKGSGRQRHLYRVLIAWVGGTASTYLGSCPLWILVAKSKMMLVLNVHTFIPSAKIDFATRVKSEHEPFYVSENDVFSFCLVNSLLRKTVQCCLENLCVRATLRRTAVKSHLERIQAKHKKLYESEMRSYIRQTTNTKAITSDNCTEVTSLNFGIYT
jgi:hypothetical protein